MPTVRRLSIQKQELTARLHENPVPLERDEIERLLVKVDIELERKRVAADEGAKALQDVADQAVAIRENMARLRDLRLAREAQAEPTND
jgi:hypothetical protein